MQSTMPPWCFCSFAIEKTRGFQRTALLKGKVSIVAGRQRGPLNAARIALDHTATTDMRRS
jgi:hypothetical protein